MDPYILPTQMIPIITMSVSIPGPTSRTHLLTPNLNKSATKIDWSAKIIPLNNNIPNTKKSIHA